MIVHINEEGREANINPFDYGSKKYTNVMKTESLLQALSKHRFDAAFGGARRDEEKSRAKERVYSFRDQHHRWDPKNQRPELWNLYNAKVNKGESIRVFPLSNWTELDVWQYIHLEKIPIVPLYFAAMRPVVDRDGVLIMVDDDRFPLEPGERRPSKNWFVSARWDAIRLPEQWNPTRPLCQRLFKRCCSPRLLSGKGESLIMTSLVRWKRRRRKVTSSFVHRLSLRTVNIRVLSSNQAVIRIRELSIQPLLFLGFSYVTPIGIDRRRY